MQSAQLLNQSTITVLRKIEELKVHKQSFPLVGLYGGTFDPIHNGHLEVVLAAQSVLPLRKVLIEPCHVPAHGKTPAASPIHRLRMLEAAVANKKGLVVDYSEYQRDTPSKTIDTLRELRERFPDVSLCFIMGLDSLLSFTTWHDWEEILTLVHLVVADRPGYALPQEGEIADLLKHRRVEDSKALQESQAGSILFFPAPQLEISSRAIRMALNSEQIASLIPPAVHHYIIKNQLYGCAKPIPQASTDSDFRVRSKL